MPRTNKVATTNKAIQSIELAENTSLNILQSSRLGITYVIASKGISYDRETDVVASE